jgi:hypothetical protein
LYGRLTILPFPFINRAIKGDLRNTDQQTHESYTLMGFNSEVSKFVGLREEVQEAE